MKITENIWQGEYEGLVVRRGRSGYRPNTASEGVNLSTKQESDAAREFVYASAAQVRTRSLTFFE